MSVLISLPVFGSAPPGGEYVVMLTNPADQPSPAETLEKTIVQPAGGAGGDTPVDIGLVQKDAGEGTATETGKENDVAKDIQLPEMADAAEVQTASNPFADKPDPPSIPPNIAAISSEVPDLTATVKPFFADVPSAPSPVNKAGAANKTDVLHQAKIERPIPSKTSAAVKSTPPPASPVQEKPAAEPDVPDVPPDPEPEAVTAMPPMFIPAKAVISVEPDRKLPPQEEKFPPVPDRKVVSSKNTAEAGGRGDIISPEDAITLPPGEATAQIPERRIALAKSAAKVQKKEGVTSLPVAMGSASEFLGKNPGGNPYPAEKPAGTASAPKRAQAGSRDSVSGGTASGSGTSSKKSGSGESAKSGPPPVGRGDGEGGTGNEAGTPSGTGTGYKLSTASLSREFGLLRGIGDAFSRPVLARWEGSPGGEIKEKGERNGVEEMPVVAIRIPEELIVQDIKIEVAAGNQALSDISIGLTVRAHPVNRRKHAKDEERKIEKAEITTDKGNPGRSATKTLTVKTAEKGVYIFSLTNTGTASSVAVVFHFHARSAQERIKEYKSLPLKPATVTKFKFLMPEAVFWDDTDRFSGSFEDAHSITKFRYDTDLLWKEEKER